ncbi:MAG: D-aminoacyl-tRNA deacylase [Eubacteriales bacterium]|nr:D-aminoacyl-tRNA deacylase [Eubacteriales bacterium]
MKLVIQRVTHASVTVEGEKIASIGKGFLVLVGMGQGDNEHVVDCFAHKMLGLRIFEDENGKTNKSLADVDGELLLVSQFTLYASCRKGFRPGFTDALEPKEANRLFEYLADKCAQQVKNVQTGRFGADMKVELLNDGPFTIILDKDQVPV